MVNYTAEFVVFMERGPHLSPESVDHKQTNKCSIRDVKVDPSAVGCHQEAARAFACKLISKHMKKAFRAPTVRDSAGKLISKYSTWEPPPIQAMFVGESRHLATSPFGQERGVGCRDNG